MTPPPQANALLQALAAGRPEAFALLYGRLNPGLLRVAATLLKCQDEAEDAVQDVFVSLARNRHRFLQVKDLDAYVFGCLRYVIVSRLARRKTEQRHLRRMAMTLPNEFAPPSTADDELDKALASLPHEQREVIALKVDGELTFAQIAQVLNVSPNTVASRHRYALDKLRRTLEESS